MKTILPSLTELDTVLFLFTMDGESLGGRDARKEELGSLQMRDSLGCGKHSEAVEEPEHLDWFLSFAGI